MTISSKNSICQISILFMLFISLTGCTLLQLREEAKILQYSTILVGNVSGVSSSNDTPVRVVAYAKNGSKRTIIHHTSLHEFGPYELMVPKGDYHLAAFEDRNQNLIYDKGEAVGQYSIKEYVSAPVGGVVDGLDIVISGNAEGKIDFPAGSVLPPKTVSNGHSTSPGAIANLDDDQFSAEYGIKGLWTPVEFYKEIGGNIYFLEEYDPEKIPILFIHGAAGSPQNFRTFFDTIDREKFQPWFYYYPSGSSLNSMSHLLYWKLYNLQSKYKFNELCITAHSMGGLVARSFIMNFGVRFPAITKFISISTPWGGERLAESGVKYSPAVVPSWEDMQPEGRFIESIFRAKFSPGIDHFLLFGHKGNRNILRPNNDKAVTLESQLDQRAQTDAKMIYGFNEDHVSILSSKQVLEQYNAILDSAYDSGGIDAAKALGNRLRVDFTFDFPAELPIPKPILLLRSVDTKQPETLINLNPEDSGRVFGPFPPGNYEVSLISPAFSPVPASIPVTIENGVIPGVEFAMIPRGYLAGSVVDGGKSSLQAGEFRGLDTTEVQIESITLKGEGITRVVTPQNLEDITYFDYFPTETDFTTLGVFNFFGLSAGEYELTVNARGFNQFSETYHVRPGQYENTLVRLTKTRDDLMMMSARGRK